MVDQPPRILQVLHNGLVRILRERGGVRGGGSGGVRSEGWSMWRMWRREGWRSEGGGCGASGGVINGGSAWWSN